MTPEEEATYILDSFPGVIKSHNKRLQIEKQIVLAINRAVYDAKERAQRAERERDEVRALYEDTQCDWVRGLEKQTELHAQIIGLTPLAEEGRKYLTRRLAVLELIGAGRYHPQTVTRETLRDITCACAENDVVNASEGIVAWYELTDKGRERLAYLRGLLGEEKNLDT